MNSVVSVVTRILLALGFRQRIKDLINVVIDVAIQEAKEEIDLAEVFTAEEKAVAKNGIDVVAARLLTLLNEKL